MEKFEAILSKQREFFERGHTKDPAFRLACLSQLERWIDSHEAAVLAALRDDLNKPPFEAYATELGLVLDELRFTKRRLKRWSRPKRVRAPLKHFPSHCTVRPEPYGIALIISPWNYPFLLTVSPLISAIAAGNCIVVKPSSYSPATSALIVSMLTEVFPENHVAIVEGGRQENEALLQEKFDKIFFTGSPTVGRVVMQAAAQHLTPVTLELGGKSPCIIDETANIPLTARRIAWGKFTNAGQTCVAPDYLLVQQSVREPLLRELVSCIKMLYGENPCQNGEYGKIINDKHFDRLLGLIDGQEVVLGGRSRRETRQIEPTLLDAVTWDSPVMQEEIFGPILPVLTFRSIAEAADLVRARPKPLALYLFTSSKANEKFILRELSFGGGCVNDTLVHLSVPRVPFGGVGESGMGSYHGKAGFDAFSHTKSILHKSRRLDIKLRYPPYEDGALFLLKKL